MLPIWIWRWRNLWSYQPTTPDSQALHPRQLHLWLPSHHPSSLLGHHRHLLQPQRQIPKIPKIQKTFRTNKLHSLQQIHPHILLPKDNLKHQCEHRVLIFNFIDHLPWKSILACCSGYWAVFYKYIFWHILVCICQVFRGLVGVVEVWCLSAIQHFLHRWWHKILIYLSRWTFKWRVWIF